MSPLYAVSTYCTSTVVSYPTIKDCRRRRDWIQIRPRSFFFPHCTVLPMRSFFRSPFFHIPRATVNCLITIAMKKKVLWWFKQFLKRKFSAVWLARWARDIVVCTFCAVHVVQAVNTPCPFRNGVGVPPSSVLPYRSRHTCHHARFRRLQWIHSSPGQLFHNLFFIQNPSFPIKNRDWKKNNCNDNDNEEDKEHCTNTFYICFSL